MTKEKIKEKLKYISDKIIEIAKIMAYVLTGILILYPITNLLLFFIAKYFPIYWSDIFNQTAILSFSEKYLPYMYHPTSTPLEQILINLVSLTIGIFSIAKNYYIIGFITGAFLIYSNINTEIYNKTGQILAVIFGIVILGFICWCSSNNEENNENKDNYDDRYRKQSSDRESKTNTVRAYNNTNNTNGYKKEKMIGSAIERNGRVIVYDENGSMLYCRSGELAGYTGNTASIKNGNRITVYDAKGSLKYSR